MERQYIYPVPSQIQKNQVKEYHCCAGLNSCKGLGKNGTGAKAGMGECATAGGWGGSGDGKPTEGSHWCHCFNNCRGQGGCGGGGSLGWQQAHPGENDCAGRGSCGIPIYEYADAGKGNWVKRVMVSGNYSSGTDKGLKSPAGPYEGQSVWQVARQLFQARMADQGIEIGPSPYPHGPRDPKQPPSEKK